MTDRIVLIVLTVIYLIGFMARNIAVGKRTAQPVKAGDGLVRWAIVLSASCFGGAIISTTAIGYMMMGALSHLRAPLLSHAGFLLFAASIVSGWVISGQLKDSWRVGVHPDQQTELINTGIYAHVRNPYFTTYLGMYFSLWLIRPSIGLSVLILATAAVFHLLVLKEEAHLLNQHGEAYESYKAATGRYLPPHRSETFLSVRAPCLETTDKKYLSTIG